MTLYKSQEAYSRYNLWPGYRDICWKKRGSKVAFLQINRIVSIVVSCSERGMCYENGCALKRNEAIDASNSKCDDPKVYNIIDFLSRPT